MRYVWTILIICMTGAACVTGVAYSSERLSEINAFIQSEIKSARSPGIAYALVKGDDVTSFAVGVKRKSTDKKVSTDTPFATGSISKSFTALAIMQLVEAGNVNLDANISEYLDAFKNHPNGIITVRQLLSHTSGYSTVQGNDTQISDRESKDALQRYIRHVAKWSLSSPPGTRFEYSNANYLILGALIEALTRQDYASYMRTEVLSPLGMLHSFVADGEIHTEMAHGHSPWFGGKRAIQSNMTDRMTAPAGGIISSANDLGLYLKMMLNGRDDIITSDSKARMMQPASPSSPFYGMGWYINTENGVASHSGLVPGSESLAIMAPNEKQAVIILVNSNGGMGFGTNARLLHGVAAIAFGDDLPNTRGVWGVRSLFLMFFIMPVLFTLAILRLSFDRTGLLSKQGLPGMLSLWMPLPIMIILAWVCIKFIPELFGVSLATFSLYQPDFVILLGATSVTGVLWAVIRLGVFYFFKRRPQTLSAG